MLAGDELCHQKKGNKESEVKCILRKREKEISFGRKLLVKEIMVS